jgi:O-antigen/teichoic acid export membrane protein
VLREPELQPEGAAGNDASGDNASGNKKPRKVSHRRNVTTSYLGAISIAAVSVLITPILTHQLGILRYGVWALIGSLIPFLEILELGFASATMAFVSRHLELEDDDRVTSTLNTSFLCLSVLGIVAFAGVMVFAYFLPDIVPTIPKSLVGQAQFLLLLLAFDMALSIPMDTFGGAISALQRFDLLNYSLMAVTVSQAIAWVIVLYLHGGLVALGIVTVAISLVGQFSRLVIAHRLLPWFRLSLRRFDRAILKAFAAATGWYSLAQIAQAVISLSDVLIVGAAAGVRSAAVYAVAERIAPLPTRVVTPRSALLFTKAGQLAARDDRSGLRETTHQVVRFVQYLSVPAAIVLGFLAGPAIEVWVGPLYREAASVVGLLCIAAVVQVWAQAVSLAISGAGRPTLPSILYGIEAALHVALGIVLASRYGAVGMAWAALIGVVLMEGMLMLPLVYRRLGDSLPRRALRAVRTVGLPAAVTAGLAWAAGRGGGPLYSFTDGHTRIVAFVGVVVTGAALMVVFYAFLLVSLPADERQLFLGRLRGALGRVRTRLH